MLDRVTNCLANINAAQRNRLPYVLCKRNNLVYRILRFLYKNRLIKGFKFYKQEFFKVYVDYEKQLDKPIIKFIKQRSSPSRYISINLKRIHLERWNHITDWSILCTMISIQKDLLTAKECNLYHIGGEIIFSINLDFKSKIS